MPQWNVDIRVVVPPLRRSRFTKIGVKPKSIRPAKHQPIQLNKIRIPDNIIVLRRGLVHTFDKRAEMEKRAVSVSSAKGSLEERITYKMLIKRQVSFNFQSSQFGGRKQLGGMVADFILLDRPVIIQVQGTIWHSGLAANVRDRVNRDLLQRIGYTVLELPDWIIHEATLLDKWFQKYIDVPIVQRIMPWPTRFFAPESNRIIGG